MLRYEQLAGGPCLSVDHVFNSEFVSADTEFRNRPNFQSLVELIWPGCENTY